MDNYIVFVSVQHFFLSFLVCSILGLQTEKKFQDCLISQKRELALNTFSMIISNSHKMASL